MAFDFRLTSVRLLSGFCLSPARTLQPAAGPALSPVLLERRRRHSCRESVLMSFGNPPADDVGRLITVEHLSDAQTVDVHRLVQQQWWGRQRTLDQVRTMVAHTSLIVALAEHADGRIIGFCRALTDFAFRATIYDVMVDAAWQRQGVGRRLLETLCAHPRLADVNFLYLACEPDLFPFYEQWGFAPYDGRAQWMVKVQHPEV